MSRILQAWIIISAALFLSAAVVSWHENNKIDDEAGAPAIQIALRPQIQGTMQFVTTEEMMNRGFGGDNTTTRFEGLRGSASSSSPPSLPTATSSLPQHYIINGKDADAGEYPWFAQHIIQVKDGFMLGGCGAVLIAPEWIATAAHCVDGPMKPTAFEVGAYCPPPFKFDNCGEKREFGKVKKAYIHEGWGPSKDGSVRNDIALFQLQDPIESIEPIQVDTGHVDLSHGDVLTAIGIGLIDQKKGKRAPVLQEVGVRFVDPDLCKVIYRDAFEKKQMICAGEEDRGTCGGDSGGPLFTKNTLVGITSFGAVKCGLIPDVYTSIAGQIGWMRDKVCVEDDPPSWCSGSQTPDEAASSGSPAAAADDDEGEDKDQKKDKKKKDKKNKDK
jgi:hypothetical protein